MRSGEPRMQETTLLLWRTTLFEDVARAERTQASVGGPALTSRGRLPRAGLNLMGKPKV